MSAKMIKIKVSQLRALIREAIGSTITGRQSMVVSADEKEPNSNLNDGKGKEQLNDVDAVNEFHNFENDFVERLSDKKYEAMAKQIFDAWGDKEDADVDWEGVVSLFARNHSKNLGQLVDKSKLYEKVLDLVEKHEDAQITKFNKPWYVG
jgi:hypothetical protein